MTQPTLIANREPKTGYIRYAYEALPVRYLGAPGGKHRSRITVSAQRVALLADSEFNINHGHYAMWVTDAKGQRIEVHIAVPPYVHLYQAREQTFTIDLYVADRNGLFSTTGNRIENLARAEWADVPVSKLQSLIVDEVNRMGVQPCSMCGLGHAWSKPPSWHARSGGRRYSPICESCRLDQLNARLEEEDKRDLRRQKRTDLLHRTKGYTHRIDAWVHPAAGGDDYPLCWYTTERPTDARIAAMLHDQGSAVLTDFTVTEL